MFSGTAQYALRATVYLAEQNGERPVPVDEVAGALGIPRNYLAKILNDLARADILASVRGKHGGFWLARPPGEISLLDVVQVFDRVDEQRKCLLGRSSCSDDDACPAHARWKQIGMEVARFVRETTVADLLNNSRPVTAGRTRS